MRSNGPRMRQAAFPALHGSNHPPCLSAHPALFGAGLRRGQPKGQPTQVVVGAAVADGVADDVGRGHDCTAAPSVLQFRVSGDSAPLERRFRISPTPGRVSGGSCMGRVTPALRGLYRIRDRERAATRSHAEESCPDCTQALAERVATGSMLREGCITVWTRSPYAQAHHVVNVFLLRASRS